MSSYLLGTRIKPSMLKTLSLDADVAGNEEWAIQNLARRGKSAWWNLHQMLGFSKTGTVPLNFKNLQILILIHSWCKDSECNLSNSFSTFSLKGILPEAGCGWFWTSTLLAANNCALTNLKNEFLNFSVQDFHLLLVKLSWGPVSWVAATCTASPGTLSVWSPSIRTWS